MQFWNAGWLAVGASFPMAYLFAATMGIYLLLRRLIDSTELDEVAVDEAETEEGLPPLSMDSSTGIPAMKPAEAAKPAASDGEASSATVGEIRGGST